MDRATAKKRLIEIIAGWSPMIAELAISMVFAGELLYELYCTEKGARLRSRCVRGDDDLWQKYYQSLVDWACDLPLEEVRTPLPLDAQSIRFMEAAQVTDSPERREVEAMLRSLQKEELTIAIKETMAQLAHSLDQVINDAISGGPPPMGEEECERHESSPAIGYLINVCIPSLLFYQRTPQKLFQEAIGDVPNLESLEILLRVDREAIHLPAIRGVRKRLDPLRAKEYDRIVGQTTEGPRQLDRLREAAEGGRAGHDELTVGGVRMLCLPGSASVGGAKRIAYRWRLQSETGLILLLMRRPIPHPTLANGIVRFGSVPLMRFGTSGCYNQAMQWLEAIGARVERNKVGRVRTLSRCTS